jgi:hypothetical protein
MTRPNTGVERAEMSYSRMGAGAVTEKFPLGGLKEYTLAASGGEWHIQRVTLSTT